MLFYHSGEGKEVVGLAKVVKTAYPDPTAKTKEGDWSCVDLVPVKPLANPVSLQTIKTDPTLKEMVLVKQSRLSVVPLDEKQFNRVLEVAGTKI